MRKIVLRSLGGITALVVLAVIVLWFMMRASLPQLEGQISITGIDNAVTIERDPDGIPTITASNRADLAFATGFVHGQDRFFQMDLIRRQAAGELSELVGGAALGVDKRFRFHRFRTRAQAAWDLASPSDQALMNAYTAGVNAGVDSLDSKPFEYFILGSEPQPWQAEDSVLTMYAMYVVLNDSRATKEIRRGLAHRVLPEAVYRWMYPQGTQWDAPIMGEPRPAMPIPGPETYSVRNVKDGAPLSKEVGRYALRGSNNWAVSGAHTTTGRAIVANDMHLSINNPNIWYQARLIVTGPSSVDVTGVTLPGGPFIVTGSNSHMAWGYTNSYGDWTDAVVLRPGSSEGTYLTPEGERAFETYVETINVKNGDPVEYSVRETIWGPVLDDVDYPDGEVVVSWIAHKPEGINFRIIDLERATSVAAAMDVANTMSMPPQNFVTGDAEGNIGWTIAGQIPRKTGFDPLLPADWSQEHGWQGWLEPDEYPRVMNPESGRIWTANSRVTDADALRVVGDGGYDLGARAGQIRDGLFASDTFTPEDMLAIQYDDRALFLSRWRDLLLDVLDDDAIRANPALAEYRDLAADWVPRAAPESVGYRLVRAFRIEVRQRVFHALMAPAREAYGDDVRLRLSNQFEGPLWSLVTEQPMHMLPGNYETWQAFLIAAVEANIDYFSTTYGGSLSERTWGERNRATIQHPLSSSIPVVGRFLDMPADPLSGDIDMPKAQGPVFGASERFAVAPGDEANSIMHMPTGQSAHPLSEFFGRGHDEWLRGLPDPFLPADAVYTLTLTPQ